MLDKIATTIGTVVIIGAISHTVHSVIKTSRKIQRIDKRMNKRQILIDELQKLKDHPEDPDYMAKLISIIVQSNHIDD